MSFFKKMRSTKQSKEMEAARIGEPTVEAKNEGGGLKAFIRRAREQDPATNGGGAETGEVAMFPPTRLERRDAPAIVATEIDPSEIEGGPGRATPPARGVENAPAPPTAGIDLAEMSVVVEKVVGDKVAQLFESQQRFGATLEGLSAKLGTVLEVLAKESMAATREREASTKTLDNSLTALETRMQDVVRLFSRLEDIPFDPPATPSHKPEVPKLPDYERKVVEPDETKDPPAPLPTTAVDSIESLVRDALMTQPTSQAAISDFVRERYPYKTSEVRAVVKRLCEKKGSVYVLCSVDSKATPTGVVSPTSDEYPDLPWDQVFEDLKIQAGKETQKAIPAKTWAAKATEVLAGAYPGLTSQITFEILRDMLDLVDKRGNLVVVEDASGDDF